MTAMESKEEISDTDSGIILHSGKNNYQYNNTALDFNASHAHSFFSLKKKPEHKTETNILSIF